MIKILFWLRVKKFQKWMTISYGDTSRFKFWSRKVEVEGIKGEKKRFSIGRNWTGIVILSPSGPPEASFSMGYYSPKGCVTEISSARRKVLDGPFGMRITEDLCSFFVVSNEYALDLFFSRYGNLKDKNLPLY